MALTFFNSTINSYQLDLDDLPPLLRDAFKLSIMMETDEVYISKYEIDNEDRLFPTLKNPNVLFCEPFKYSEITFVSQTPVKMFYFGIIKIPESKYKKTISDFIALEKNLETWIFKQESESILNLQKDLEKQKLFEEAFKVLGYDRPSDKREYYQKLVDEHKYSSYTFDDYRNGMRIGENGLKYSAKVFIIIPEWEIPTIVQAEHKGVRSLLHEKLLREKKEMKEIKFEVISHTLDLDELKKYEEQS